MDVTIPKLFSPPCRAFSYLYTGTRACNGYLESKEQVRIGVARYLHGFPRREDQTEADDGINGESNLVRFPRVSTAETKPADT
jgi:hypothetical protein